jgi:hypothetical protein
MESKKRSPIDFPHISKNQKFSWNFFKKILKGVTAKLNKIALFGVLVDLKNIFLFKNELSFKQKKPFVLIFFYARVIRKILLSR